jgi:hypothetical protein
LSTCCSARLVLQQALDLGPGRRVAGVDDGQVEGVAQARPGLGGAQQLGDAHDMLFRSAIGAAGHEDHVGAELADALDLLVRQALVVGGDSNP